VLQASESVPLALAAFYDMGIEVRLAAKRRRHVQEAHIAGSK
jgi:hypothetical protein